MKARRLLLAALLLAVASARAGSQPDNVLDECTGGVGAIHVAGWAYDPDASSQSIDIHVYLFTDSACANQYGEVRVLTTDVSRPDVNQAKGITGDHGFDADIPVADVGTYWVKVFAIDATGDGNPQIGATQCVTVTAPVPPGPDCTMTVTKFHQSYPYAGRATVEYTVGGTLPSNAVAKIVVRTDAATATFVQSNIVAGANTNVIDFASSFGGALLLSNATFEVAIMEDLGGVQLWENGPYWAECNVGAATPQEFGYYFWWGDTVGYRRENNAWSAADGSASGFLFESGNTPTDGKDDAALLSAGYIDSTTNLVAAHDAATAHLGAPWRMPTDAEFAALLNNCTNAWITTNGVNGRLVTGKGDYADRSIFLPAAGYGYDSILDEPGLFGYYWSSTPISDFPERAWSLNFLSDVVYPYFYERCHGRSVRPVREELALCSADGTVTYDPSETQTTPIPVPNAWLDGHPDLLAGQSGDYEAAANATAANGRKVWACYVAGLDPSDPLDDFRITRFWMEGDAPMFELSSTTNGSGQPILPYVKPLGKANLADAWLHVPDGGNPAFRFFAAEVLPPGCESIVDDGVQLWEGGPYWAKCNVGAATPEESGYFFWWGDTVGYTRIGSGWGSVKDGTSLSFSDSGTAASTYGKDDAALLAEGWIDSTGNLVAAHDAATAHLGSPWRMPTDNEIIALASNCTTKWIITNGVNGRLVTGKGNYANRSIFFPATGYGFKSFLYNAGSYGHYWSSTVVHGDAIRASCLKLHSGSFGQQMGGIGRYDGLPVRPVRDAD